MLVGSSVLLSVSIASILCNYGDVDLLQIHPRPTVLQIRAPRCIVFRPSIADTRKRSRLQQGATQRLIEGCPILVARPVGIPWNNLAIIAWSFDRGVRAELQGFVASYFDLSELVTFPVEVERKCFRSEQT